MNAILHSADYWAGAICGLGFGAIAFLVGSTVANIRTAMAPAKEHAPRTGPRTWPIADEPQPPEWHAPDPKVVDHIDAHLPRNATAAAEKALRDAFDQDEAA